MKISEKKYTLPEISVMYRLLNCEISVNKIDRFLSFAGFHWQLVIGESIVDTINNSDHLFFESINYVLSLISAEFNHNLDITKLMFEYLERLSIRSCLVNQLCADYLSKGFLSKVA